MARAEGREAFALSIDYGQRHRHELRAAERVARALGAAEHRTIALDLRAIGGSALTSDAVVPKSGDGHTPTTPGEIPVTYVPARNLTFLSLCLGYAEVIDARELWIGVNAVDYSGYPDCRPAFIDAFERVANLATRAGVLSGGAGQGPHFAIRTPLIDLTKAEIILRGAALGVDFSMTHSCYDPVPADVAHGDTPEPMPRACGRCDSCVIRRRGFADAGVPDPTRYAGTAP